MIGWRLYLVAGVGLVVLAALWRYSYVVKELRETKAELEIAEAQAAMLDEARVRDQRVADELSAIRGDMSANARKFNSKLDSLKVTREVPREGDTCTERDPAVYRGLFNEAVDGVPASPDSLF